MVMMITGSTTSTAPSTHEEWKRECEKNRTLSDPLCCDRFEHEEKATNLMSYTVKEDTESYNVSAT